MITLKTLPEAMDRLFLIEGVSSPTEQETTWAKEAVIYANPAYYKSKYPKVQDLFEKRMTSYYREKKRVYYGEDYQATVATLFDL